MLDSGTFKIVSLVLFVIRSSKTEASDTPYISESDRQRADCARRRRAQPSPLETHLERQENSGTQSCVAPPRNRRKAPDKTGAFGFWLSSLRRLFSLRSGCEEFSV